MFSPRCGPPLVALAAVGATLATLPPEAGGPGVTCDEFYHVAAGKRLVEAWRSQGVGFWRPENIRRKALKATQRMVDFVADQG